ncbi:MAG: TolC family protein [Holophagales bacterium]|nr:TolC family protein [Holophagales bacterium]
MLRHRVTSALTLCLCVAGTVICARAQDVRRLSLHDAIQAALANNLAIEIQRSSWQGIKEAGTLSEEAVFEWQLSATAQGSWSKSGSSSFSDYLVDDEYILAQQDTLTYNNGRGISATVLKPFTWGGEARLTYSPSYSGWNRSTTSTLLEPPNTVFELPSFSNQWPYSGSWGFSYSQNLLKGFGRKAATGQLIIARRGLTAADANFRRALQDQVALIERVYWNLVNAQMNLVNKRQALDIAQQQLKENQIRVETGVLAPIEVTSSEANVALQEVAIIQAEAGLLNAKDTFVRTVYSTAESHEEIELTDAPIVTPLDLEESDAIETALKNRVELLTGRLDLENAKLSEDIAHSNLKPTLNASVSYNGTAISADSIGPVHSDLFGFRYPGYNVNLNFVMPLQNKSARAVNVRARANRRSAELALRDQELAITLDVRTAYRNLQAAEKSIAASEKSRILAQATYDAEHMRFANGLSTNFVVLQRLNDLDNAKTTELDAKIAYVNAKIALQQAMGTLLEYRNIKVQ